jgi:aminoglycoside 3-N-acetyltransferase
MVTKPELRKAILAAGLADQPVCLHSSLKSFGWIRGGPRSLLDVLLEAGSTVLVPTFSYAYLVRPPPHLRCQQNGIDYACLDWIPANNRLVYSPESDRLDLPQMGRIPQTVLEMRERVRGRHPLCSFAAVGPLAAELIEPQTPLDVYAPLRELARLGGRIALMGVGLNRLTALHLAEQMAGRRPFIRWANGQGDQVITAACGGDSAGFERLAPYVRRAEIRTRCGGSDWRVFDAATLLELTRRTIEENPSITHCQNSECLRCEHAAAGGPSL